MTYLGNEETLVEIPTINYLKDKLGYDFIHGQNLIPENGERDSITEVILTKRFSKSLRRLNPWMNTSHINQVIKYIVRPEKLGASTLEINEKLHDDIINLNHTVDFIDNSHRKPRTVEFIDFNNINNNEFLVVRQFVIKGPQETIIPDIVIFINGIPIVVIECKSPFLENVKNVLAGKHKAYIQLKRYMNERETEILEGAPRLFYTNFLCGITNKYHGYLGTIGSSQSGYLEWKDPYPCKLNDIEEYNNSGQNIFLHGVLEKKNLLDIMRNFIVFEGDSKKSSKVKKTCRYQQYRAVNKALNNLKTGKDKLERGGVIWHTQGSGKSLAMVFLAAKIRKDPKLHDSTIVVVTDRDSLDKQIYKTFRRTLSKYTEPVRAKSIKHLKELLSKAQAQIITTLIQKFQTEDEGSTGIIKQIKQFEVLTTKSSVIVLCDEAHRSQYRQMAKNMRDGLPNAAFIGFTGTPIDKEDRSTPRTFGSYIDKYSLEQAVKDNTTVKIIYEGRKPDLQIKGDNLEALFDKVFSDRTQEEKEAIKERYVTKLPILEAKDRIKDIAIDILNHYKDAVYPNGFKAQVVAPSRTAAVTYFNMLTKHMKKITGLDLEAKIIYSSEDPNEDPRLKKHRTTTAERQKLIDRFLKPIAKDKLSFLIVVDMLLTGFDAPIEQVMYLDKPLIEHNLLQAIARVNRTYDSKKSCGYVIDYYGVSNHLEEALAIFDKDDIGKPMDSISDIYKLMQDYREEVMAIFKGIDPNDIDALVDVIEKEDKRSEFELSYKRFATILEQLLPTHVPTEYINNLRWLSYIRAAAKARFEPQNALDISDCGNKVKEIISRHLISKGVKDFIEPITLFGNYYEEKLAKITSDKGKASSMEHAIRNIITVKIDNNPVYYTSLLEKLKKILEETEKNWIERRLRLKEFIDKDIRTGEHDRATELGLTKKQFSFFEAIRDQLQYKEEDYIGQKDLDIIKEITGKITKLIKDKFVIDWTTNISKTQDIEREIELFLISNYFNILRKDGIEKLVPKLINLAKVHYRSINNNETTN